MKLSLNDIAYLMNELGYSPIDVEQIKQALKKTKFTRSTPKDNGEQISAEEARKILGERPFLSGLGRCAFHWSAVRQNDDGTIVHFESTSFFKK